MNYLIEQIRDSNSLQHHGIKGMHWGIRRYRDANGHYTEEGKKRYIQDKTNMHRLAVTGAEEQLNNYKSGYSQWSNSNKRLTVKELGEIARKNGNKDFDEEKYSKELIKAGKANLDYHQKILDTRREDFGDQWDRNFKKIPVHETAKGRTAMREQEHQGYLSSDTVMRLQRNRKDARDMVRKLYQDDNGVLNENAMNVARIAAPYDNMSTGTTLHGAEAQKYRDLDATWRMIISHTKYKNRRLNEVDAIFGE